MNELNDHLYRNWVITPELLALEREIVWFRPPGCYLYLRESVLSDDDHQRALLPNNEIADCEIIGIANHRTPGNPSRAGLPRRIWVLNHKVGLDGIDPPAPAPEFSGFIVPVEAVKSGEYSELGASDREISVAEVEQATAARERYLAYMAEWEIQQAAKRKRWQEMHNRKQALSFSNPELIEAEAEDARLAADDIARREASARALKRNPYRAPRN